MAPIRIDPRSNAPTDYPAEAFESGVREHCELVLRSPLFDASERSREFLRFVIDETLSGRGEGLNQASIAIAVFGRDGKFDAVMDPIVRVQAGRLRRSLERYYLLTGRSSSIHIELPKGKYAPRFVEAELEDPPKPVLEEEEPDDRPVVLIPPFETSSNIDGESAMRLNDELATELFRYGTVRVVRKRDLDDGAFRPHVAPRFELRCCLRRAGEDSSVRASLVDKRSGVQLWGDEFHTNAVDECWWSGVGDIGRVIAARVGDEHGIVLRQIVSEHAARNAHGVPPMGAVLHGHHFFCSRQASDLVPAIRDLQRATAREPDNPLAWIQLARLCLANYAYELSDLSTPIETTVGYAYQGALLDPVDTRASCVLASALFMKGEIQPARERIDQALRQKTDSFVYREAMGWLLALCGDWDRGMAVVRDTASRNPFCMPHVKQALWADHLRRGDFEKSYIAALEYRDSSGFWPQLMAACCLGHLGKLNEAQAPAADLLAAKPAFASDGRRLVGYFFKSPGLRAAIFDGLEKAGVQLA